MISALGVALDSAAKPRNKKLILGIAAVIVAAIVVLSVIVIYYSPEYSWSSSVRDHDGDGASDKSDPEPFDASIWGLCEGYINLTVYNNSTDYIFFNIHACSSDLIQNLSLDHLDTSHPGTNLTQLLKLDWLGGPDTTNVSVYVSGVVSTDWKSYSWSSYLDIVNSDHHTISLVVPDDFNVSYFYG